MSDTGDRIIRDLEFQLDETTSAIVEKLRKMEERLKITVDEARAMVGSAAETFEKVKESVDVRKQVQEHPVPAFAVAVAAGAIAASFRGSHPRKILGAGTEFGLHLTTGLEDEIRLFKRLLLVAALGFLKSKTREWIDEWSPKGSVKVDKHSSLNSQTSEIIH